MSIVYVVQEPLMRDRVSGEVRPKFDISPARKYGEVRYLLNWSDDCSDPESLVKFLTLQLKDYSSVDYILVTGNPNAMAIATCIAARNTGGLLKLLSWNNLERRYIEFPVCLHTPS